MVAVLHEEHIPHALRERAQWVCWRYEERDGKQTKVPYSATTHRRASSTNPATWATFEQANLERVRRGYSGVGFVVTKDCGIVGVDLDHCLNGRLEPWAADVVRDLDSYTEITPSGEGLRVFACGALPEGGRKVGNLELYDSGRFLTVTGQHYDDTPLSVEERTEALARVHARMVAGVGKPAGTHTLVSTSSQPLGALDDAALIKKASAADDGGKFARLWAGDTSLHGGDDSAADMALVAKLLFWTGGDTLRTKRLFERSGLYRPKWDERRGATGETYGDITVRKALSSYRAERNERPAGAAPHRVASEQDAGIRSLRSLMAKDLKPPRHVVNGLLAPGLFILAGKPKIGKSWTALNIALAVSAGGMALGRIPIPEPTWTLLLALEDTEWRLRERVSIVLGPDAETPERFDYDLECPKLTEGGLDKIEAWLKDKPTGSLVIVDVWKRVKPAPAKGANAYDADYEAGQMLKRLADQYSACIVVLHHLNKIVSDDDVDTISGSIGFSGVADGHIVMKKAGKNGAVLRGRGRDVQEFDHALEWAPDVGTWSIIGDAEDVEASRIERETVEAVAEFGKPVKPGDLATALGIKYEAAKQRLFRLARRGLIVSLNDGTYYTSLSPLSPAVTVSPESLVSVAGQDYRLAPFPSLSDTGDSGDSSDTRDTQDQQDTRNSSDVFVLRLCRGTCGSYLRGSEQRSGICRTCAQDEVERASEPPF